MKNIIYILLGSIFLLACEETVQLDLRQTAPRVVIEGMVTDVLGKQYVKLSRTVDFYSSGETPRITDATVRVLDDAGNTYDFVHNPGAQEDSAGFYLPQVPFTGLEGRTYTLVVNIDGVEYTGSDKLLPVIPVDSLASRINDDQEEDPEDEGQIYEVLMFAREPQDQENFYLFKFFRNDTLNLFNETDIYYSDDDFLAENINGVASPAYFKLGDNARVEVYSLTRTGYVYFNDLWSVLNNDSGGMFGPIPSSPRTNLTNNALGFFQVSSMKSREIVIKE